MENATSTDCSRQCRACTQCTTTQTPKEKRSVGVGSGRCATKFLILTLALCELWILRLHKILFRLSIVSRVGYTRTSNSECELACDVFSGLWVPLASFDFCWKFSLAAALLLSLIENGDKKAMRCMCTAFVIAYCDC